MTTMGELIQECKPPFVVWQCAGWRLWCVILKPDGTEVSATYGTAKAAQEEEERLNAAYYKGWRDAVERIAAGKTAQGPKDA